MTNFYRYLLLIITFTVFYASLLAQDVTLNVGVDVDNPNKAVPDLVVGFDEDNFYTISYNRKGLRFLETYNRSTGALRSSREVKFKKGKDEYSIDRYIVQDGRILLISVERDKTEETVFANFMDMKGKLIGKWERLDRVTKDGKRDRMTYEFHYEEKSQMLYVIRLDPYDKKGNEKLNIIGYDKDLNKIFNKRVILPYKDKNFAVSSTIVRNDKVYMLGRILLEKEEIKAAASRIADDDDEDFTSSKSKNSKKGAKPEKVKVPTVIYTLLTFTFAGADSTEAKEFKIDLKEKAISGIRIGLMKDKFLLTGIYTTPKSTGAAGVFYAKVDEATGNVEQLNVEKFDAALIETNGLKGKKGDINTGGIPNLVLRNLSFNADGSAILSGEIYYTYQICYTDRYGTRCVTHYVYGNIITINFNSSGEVNFFAFTPKFMDTTDGGVFAGYHTFHSGDKVFYLYNENPKVFEKPKGGAKPKKPTQQNVRYSTMIPVITSVDKDGNMERYPLVKPGKDKKTPKNQYRVRPKEIMQIGDKEFFAVGYSKTRGKYKIVKFNVD